MPGHGQASAALPVEALNDDAVGGKGVQSDAAALTDVSREPTPTAEVDRCVTRSESCEGTVSQQVT